jgi:hypothetical protein
MLALLASGRGWPSVPKAVRAHALAERNPTLHQPVLKEIQMKSALLLAGGILCACSWHANAQDTTANPTTTAQTSATSSEGPDATTTSMSGGPAAFPGKTRAQVYQELVRSMQDGESARLQELYRGN